MPGEAGRSADTLNALSRELQAADALAGPSECHGLLAGLAAGLQLPPVKDWLSLVLGESAPEQHPELVRLLAGTLMQIGKDLAGENALSFQLLLPPDTASLQDRVAALADWCRGFLMGLRLSAPGKLPDDAREILRDFEAITQAGYDPDLPEESQEADFTELEEFVRMGVTLIHTELHEKDAPQPGVH